MILSELFVSPQSSKKELMVTNPFLGSIQDLGVDLWSLQWAQDTLRTAFACIGLPWLLKSLQDFSVHNPTIKSRMGGYTEQRIHSCGTEALKFIPGKLCLATWLVEKKGVGLPF